MRPSLQRQFALAASGGYGGFAIDTPDEVRLAAEKIYARFD